MEREDEIAGLGNSLNFGARQYDSRIARWFSQDPLKENYADASSYNFVLNNPINAIDPDGRLVLFVNGFRPDAILTTKKYRPPTNYDLHTYWKGIDDKFVERIGDDSKLYYDANNAPLGKASQRYQVGRTAGLALIKSIKDGDVEYDEKNETVKVVSHSQGAAYAAGMIDVLVEEGYKVESTYFLAPKNPTDIRVNEEVGYSAQYGSNEEDDPIWTRDQVAPQGPMNNVDERAYIPYAQKKKDVDCITAYFSYVFKPIEGITRAWEDDRLGPLDSHYINNYNWVFDIAPDERGYVKQREDNALKEEDADNEN